MNINKIIFHLVALLIMPFLILFSIFSKLFSRADRKAKMGLINIEFFHKDAGGFGGYGKSAKNITDYFNGSERSIKVEMLLPTLFHKPTITSLHNTNTIIGLKNSVSNIGNIFSYIRILNMRNIDVLMTIEYCTCYEYPLLLLPHIPLIVWIHDPRPREEVEKIATVSLEVLASKESGVKDFIRSAERKKNSIKKIIRLSKLYKRKIVFGTTAYSLIELARKTYGIEEIEAVLLPTPVEMPSLNEITFSSRPSFCFLGRLDPIKRPWIFFELAKRFKDIDFFVAGITHFPEIMGPIIKEYTSIPNLKFLGFTIGKEKHEILKNTWAVINTSIHEALPVSFLESFSYGKPIISGQNPDNMAERFGIFTGEVLGDAFEGRGVDIYADAIKTFISKRDEMKERGRDSREFVRNNYSFKNFDITLNNIISSFRS